MKEFDNEESELAWFVGLVEGEGSFFVTVENNYHRHGQGGFKLGMTDLDVIERAAAILRGWDIDLNIRLAKIDERPKAAKQIYRIATNKASYLKIIIDKTYDYFSEKKQGDCDRVLKNLAERGLL